VYCSRVISFSGLSITYYHFGFPYGFIYIENRNPVIYEKKVQTVMVNNAININKMNRDLSPQTTDHKKSTAYAIENTVLV
jgi:hypothetical protein